MARLYINFQPPQLTSDGFDVVVNCFILDNGARNEFGLSLPFAGEPSGNEITGALRTICIAIGEAMFGASLAPGQTVIFGGPV